MHNINMHNCNNHRVQNQINVILLFDFYVAIYLNKVQINLLIYVGDLFHFWPMRGPENQIFYLIKNI